MGNMALVKPIPMSMNLNTQIMRTLECRFCQLCMDQDVLCCIYKNHDNTLLMSHDAPAKGPLPNPVLTG